MKKLEDRKSWENGKASMRIENILFSPLFVWLKVKKWKDGKNEFKK